MYEYFDSPLSTVVCSATPTFDEFYVCPFPYGIYDSSIIVLVLYCVEFVHYIQYYSYAVLKRTT